MTDAALRELERTAHAGDIVSAARLLVARVRLGELSLQDLELAAHVGHEPAALALGIEPAQSAWTSICVKTEELVNAVHELQRFGREVLVVVSTTGVELVRPWRSVTEAEHLASAVQAEPIGEAARSTVRVVRLAVEAVNDFTTAPVSAVRCVLQSALIYRAIWR